MLQKSLIRRLDLLTLQLFVAVHEEGTLTRAAARESIAVSAASKRLMELEVALGISLFVRQAKGMTLTPAGETLLHHARQMLFNVEKMGLELGEHSHGIRGYVRMLANLSAIKQSLIIVPPPFHIPSFTFVLVWHKRRGGDQALNWLNGRFGEGIVRG